VPVRRSVGERRREAIIEAAYTLFMDRGYETVSIDDIIRAAGGSKATLYKFFGNKEGVLRAVVESLAETMLRELKIEFPSAGTAREILLRIGAVLTDLALSDNAINQHRHAVAHARAFPDVARLWFESGPSRTMDGIAAVLRRLSGAGKLRVDDPLRAAWHFGGLIIFRENMRRLAGLPPAGRAELHKNVVAAVDLFLAAYGT
jgi:TetR/AcrR family transcriptional repressor of mexJK operon